MLASAVIYTHSYWLVTGIRGQDGLTWLLSEPLSTYAVDGFFFLSGFLVYPSLLRFKSVSLFILARLVRLWPGLAGSVLATFLVGMLLATVPPIEYITGRETLRFLAGNLTFLFGAYHLTGVNCFGRLCNLNGSLWTLPWEARCYAALAALGVLGLAKPKIMKNYIVPATLVATAVWQFPHVQEFTQSTVGEGLSYMVDVLMRLWGLFALGTAAYLFRQRLKLSWLILTVLFGTNLVAHQFLPAFHVRALFVGYAVLCFGLLTAQQRALSARWPDYSYGTYIYAFPVMVLVQSAVHARSFIVLATLTFIATIPVAALSWHLIEKPCLDALRARRHVRLTSPILQP